MADNNLSLPVMRSFVECEYKHEMTWNVFFPYEVRVATILTIIVNLLTMPSIIFINALTMYFVRKHHFLHKARFAVLAFLSLPELLSCLITQPLLITRKVYNLQNIAPSCELDVAFFFFLNLFSGVSYYQLVAIGYDRHLAISEPFHYKNKITINKQTIITTFNWAFHILKATCSAFLLPADARAYLELVYFLASSVALCFSMCWYALILSSILNQNNRHFIVYQKRLFRLYSAKPVVFIVCSYVFSFIPIITYCFKFSFFSSNQTLLAAQPWLDVCVLLFPLFNAIIYCFNKKELQTYFLRLLDHRAKDGEPVQTDRPTGRSKKTSVLLVL